MNMLLAEEASSIGTLIWTFVNSPVGVSIISGLVLFILARVWKAKPAWEKVYNEHKGLFFDAVRTAEAAIPNDVEGTAGKRADAALQLILKLEHSIARKSKNDLRLALDKAHTELEVKAEVKARRARLDRLS